MWSFLSFFCSFFLSFFLFNKKADILVIVDLRFSSVLSTSISTLCAFSLFSLPAALTVFLWIVDPSLGVQAAQPAVNIPSARPSRLGGGMLGAAPCLQVEPHIHATPCNPWARSVSSSPLVSTNTQHILSPSLALLLCSHCHTSTAHNPRACWEN